MKLVADEMSSSFSRLQSLYMFSWSSNRWVRETEWFIGLVYPDFRNIDTLVNLGNDVDWLRATILNLLDFVAPKRSFQVSALSNTLVWFSA
jgi:hypothetical protein